MFLVARDFYEMLVLCRGKHATWSSTVGIRSKVRVYRALIHKYIVGRRSTTTSRQPAFEVLITNEHMIIQIKTFVQQMKQYTFQNLLH